MRAHTVFPHHVAAYATVAPTICSSSRQRHAASPRGPAPPLANGATNFRLRVGISSGTLDPIACAYPPRLTQQPQVELAGNLRGRRTDARISEFCVSSLYTGLLRNSCHSLSLLFIFSYALLSDNLHGKIWSYLQCIHFLSFSIFNNCRHFANRIPRAQVTYSGFHSQSVATKNETL